MMLLPIHQSIHSRYLGWRQRVFWKVYAAILGLVVSPSGVPSAFAADRPLMAGVAKVNIANPEAGKPRGELYAKALVLKQDSTTVVIVTLDVVAIGEIGTVDNGFLSRVRNRIENELQIPASNTIFNSSHCHGIVARDIDERTFEAVKMAAQNMVPVQVGVGTALEDRISENRRLKLKSGQVVDVRHAYSMPSDDEVAEIGPIDPEIGILRIDRTDKLSDNTSTLAVLYNFACHPIQGVPTGANTSDMTGFASQAIEDSLENGTIALFVQGCAGDVNPVFYKDVDHPRDAQLLGNQLALSTLRGLRAIECRDDSRLKIVSQRLTLPRANFADRIQRLEAEETRLVKSLRGTSLNLKTFMSLATKYQLATDYPSYYSHRYMLEKLQDREDLRAMDATNRKQMRQYIENVMIMEELTRVQTNLALLRKHEADNASANSRMIEVEIVALRVGDFALVTFPGELTVQIGLNLKSQSPHSQTFVAGYTNGYIYYAPTADQLRNPGAAQEDSDSILAPEWQSVFESRAIDLLRDL